MSTPTSSAATCRRLRTTPMSKILREANAGELPALVGVEEIAVGGAAMAARGRAAAAAQHELAAHKLAIIFADRARRGAETGIGAVGAAGPFPHAAEHLLQVRVAVLRRRLDRAGRIGLLARTPPDRKRGVWGKGGYVRVDLGGRRA